MQKALLGHTCALRFHPIWMFIRDRSGQFAKRLLIFVSISPGSLQLENPLPGRMNQLSRYQKKPVPDGGNHGLDLGLIQYLFLEKIHEVVSQHQQLEPSTVSGITVGYHLVQAQAVNTFLDEVLTAGPLIVESPDFLRSFLAVCHHHLVVVFDLFGVKELQLFLGTSIGPYLLPHYHHPQHSSAVNNIVTLTYTKAPSNATPPCHIPYLALHPWLHGHHHGKLNTLSDQILDQINTEKSTVCPQPDLPNMGGKFFDQGLDKLNTLIAAMVLAASKHPSNVIPCLTYKAQQGVVTLSSLLLGIVAYGGPLLIAVNRNHMGVQIQCDLPIALVAVPQLHDKVKVQSPDLVGHRYLHRGQKSADSRLNRKTTEPHYLLKYLVNTQDLHMIGPAVAQKHAIETGHKQLTHTVLALSTALYFDVSVKHLLNPIATEKSSDQPGTAKVRQITSIESFSYLDYLSFAFWRLLRYCLFHFLSASFVVLVFFRCLSITTFGGTFV